jgi:WhiB family redox-sensing transcriptional regulator
LGLFFGPDAEFVTARRDREAKAKAICARCPVKAECLEYALDTREAFGVWGSLNEDERRAILRRQRSAS